MPKFLTGITIGCNYTLDGHKFGFIVLRFRSDLADLIEQFPRLSQDYVGQRPSSAVNEIGRGGPLPHWSKMACR